MDDMKKGISITDILKFLGGLVVFIPLMLGIFQYKQSIKQDSDKSFRSVIEKLSSLNREERLASASSIGTFMDKGSSYYDESVNLLINRLSIELDYNVLNAIRGSLEKIKKEEYKNVIDKLLAIERNTFVQEFALKNWRDEANTSFGTSENRYIEREKLFKKYKLDLDKKMLDNLKEDVDLKWAIYTTKERDFSELSMHKQVISDFLSIFLGVTKTHPIKELVFFQNSMNSVVMVELNFANSEFKLSTFSSSTILNTKFNGSAVTDTFFTGSDLTNSRFVNCKIEVSLFDRAVLKKVDFSGSEFRDVFFAGSDLTGTNFNNTKGLKSIYFYGATNLDKAIFDPAFRKELDEELKKITKAKLKEYVDKSELSITRRDEFYKTLDKLKM